MSILTYSFFILAFLVINCTACIPTIPPEEVGFVERVIHQLETLPDPPPPVAQIIPVIQVIKKEIAKTNKVVIAKTTEVAEKVNKPFKEVTSVFAGCHVNQIKFISPETGRKLGKTIIPPILTCVKTSLFGCDTVRLSCIIPQNSKYPLISGFAKIDGADWATTDLKASRADFQLECDVFNRWIYISDIPGLEGKIYPTNEVSCLLVPIITDNNQIDFEDMHYDV
ncbi:hypothetical protein CRE_00018 [Caenorhabditis remanei]|uniref:Uncharacterized protein n=1 Tax=Caenorhabditis remanei TaxID=31234 RepID=E3LCC1_CAERE|nr:hypothetical protein CRE_00018 [Caenorhabditis remanei]